MTFACLRLRLILTTLTLAALLGCAAAPGVRAQSASAYRKVLGTYEQKGTIPACQFSPAQLSAALRGVDVYGQQYFADFTAAIQRALAQRDAGACSGPPPTASSGTSGAGSDRALPLGPVTASTGAGIPLPLLILGALVALMALAGGLVALGRARGTDLAPAGPWRHLWQEAAWRAGGVWEDFRDWRRSA
ncbi:MAG: hypothetical protein M3Z27_04910 [Actinomycetota bacterium]|nr:hypothetical protein [Actinomycetota bacterium]